MSDRPQPPTDGPGPARAIIGDLGRAEVFWPALLFTGVLNHGPGGLGSRWTWLAVLVLVGPVLALAITMAKGWRRDRPAGPPGPIRSRALAHLRGTH